MFSTSKGPFLLDSLFSPNTRTDKVFEVMKGKDLHARLLRVLGSAKLSFRMEGQIKCFPDKVKLKEFIITKLLCEMLKGLI